MKFNEKTAITAARVTLGLVFLVMGLNKIFNFIPAPPQPEPAIAFFVALKAVGYMFPLITAVEILGGIALITGFWAPLALILLAPIMINILLFHMYLSTNGILIAFVIVAVALFLGHSYRATYKPLFKRK